MGERAAPPENRGGHDARPVSVAMDDGPERFPITHDRKSNRCFPFCPNHTKARAGPSTRWAVFAIRARSVPMVSLKKVPQRGR